MADQEIITQSSQIDDIVKSPVACGFLLQFCEKTSYAELVHFWVVVDVFKNRCRGLNFSDAGDLETFGGMIASIYQNFLSPDALFAIILPKVDRAVTLERIQKHLFHQDKVFDTALVEPLATLANEILPFFF